MLILSTPSITRVVQSQESSTPLVVYSIHKSCLVLIFSIVIIYSTLYLSFTAHNIILFRLFYIYTTYI